MRTSKLPLIPGYSFNENIGQTKFHKSHHFISKDGVTGLADGIVPGIGGVPLGPPAAPPVRTPCVYPRGEGPEVPAWVAYDKHCLAFNAHYQHALFEKPPAGYIIRKCILQYFLEDGTMKVLEPKIRDSGIPQGVLIKRHRFPLPPPHHHEFYDILHLNVGKEVLIYGKVFKITDCDKFTRIFLNKLGIQVPEALNTPEDPYYTQKHKERAALVGRTLNKKHDKRGPFLANDRKVLRFWGYWDDRFNQYGILHKLEIFFYLADNTIQINDLLPRNSGRDVGPVMLGRNKVPKFFTTLPNPGQDQGDPQTILNVITNDGRSGKHMVDSLRVGYDPPEYYKETDFTIGAAIEVYGRKIILVDCDEFTKEYYRTKYGLDNFDTKLYPPEAQECAELPPRKLPVWNGYGSYEDSAQNCMSVVLKPPKSDFIKFIKYDKEGFNSRVLRFSGRMVSKDRNDECRYFIIRYFLADETMSIYELAKRNSGYLGGKFYRRTKFERPGQAVFLSEPPLNFNKADVYIGSILEMKGFKFEFLEADEYALRYMELHPKEFPKADVELIIEKIRTVLKPDNKFKDFVAKYMQCTQQYNVVDKCVTVVPRNTLRTALLEILPNHIVEHEVITLCRHFAAERREGPRYKREAIRALLHTELRRFLWSDLERLEEHFRHLDSEHTGHIDRKTMYYALKGCRVPLDGVLLDRILDVLDKNEKCEINYRDLIDFFNLKLCPVPGIPPVNIKYDLHWCSESEPDLGYLVNWTAFLEAINLEEDLKKQSE